ncbi:helix-turn-helix domain-containing protein [Kitasatospora sp. NPDC094015]|uniref:TetR/AcrR family transcriptional regulator n=1 Tax=Kitasatospora sp. NPDC094015 TaxID=3155205 RepID=UPI00331BC472
MTDQDQVTGPTRPQVGHGVVPEQRGPGGAERLGESGSAAGYEAQAGRSAAASRLRVDARRNLESVLRAARQVFGELGYDAPMEEVARRAGVGVGTVYRRFPSKEVLVQRIAAEEVGWLTAQARESLYGDAQPWEALSGFLARAVESGAGRLLPPESFRYAEDIGRVPEQRRSVEAFDGRAELRPAGEHGGDLGGALGRHRAEAGALEAGGAAGADVDADADPRLLLHLLAALVARAGAAGELRPGVTVSDVVLVLTAAVPAHAVPVRTSAGDPDDAPADRLLRILLQGLRAR